MCTCTELQQRPAGFMDLQKESGLAEVQPDHAPFLRQVKGEQKPRLVPRPELEPNEDAPRRGRPRSRQLEEALGARERHGHGNRLSTRKGHIALREKMITREIKQH